MRYSQEQKEQARQRLVESSTALVKKNGFAASGVDALAAAAGVTTGSLYKHFSGKTELFATLLQSDIQRTVERFSKLEPGDSVAAEIAIDRYLSTQHVREAASGCPLPALAPEIARADPSVRKVFDQGLLDVHAALAAVTGESESAWALIAQNVGALMLSRAALDPKLQKAILSAAKRQARQLLHGTPRSPPES